MTRKLTKLLAKHILELVYYSRALHRERFGY